MILVLVVTVVLLCSVHLLFNYNASARALKKIPGAPLKFIVGNTLDFMLPPVELFRYMRTLPEVYKNISRLWCYPYGGVNLYNPEDIEIILSNSKYNDKSIIYKFVKPWLQEGLLVSGGAKWQLRRKIMTPAFHFNILRHFKEVLEENSQKLADTLDTEKGEVTVDVKPILSDYTLQSICETAMGTRLDEEVADTSRSYKEAIYEIGKLLAQRFSKLYLSPDFIFNLTKAGKRHQKYVNVVHDFTKRVVKDRKDFIKNNGITFNQRDINKDGSDEEVYYHKNKIALLDLLIAAQQNELIDDAGIQEEVDTFMFEGHDTTASGLSYLLMELANNKEIQDKIVTELKIIFGDSTRAATMQDLAKMKYLDCCIKESLRLYPPVYFISRELHDPVILKTAMGTRLDEEVADTSRSYKEAIYEIGKLLAQRFSKLYLSPDFIFNLTKAGKRHQKYVNVVHDFTKRVVKDRKDFIKNNGITFNQRDINKDGSDEEVYYHKNKIALLDLLIAAQQNELIDDAGIQEEVDTFMFEGHDTTASGLSYLLMELANNKEIQDKIVTELKIIFGDSTRAATMQDLAKMKYLDCCIKESLRLYPPVYFISRELHDPVILSNYEIPGGTLCHIHIFNLHRREDLFKDALKFNPDRFLPENSVGRHPYAYIPFSAGPRNCIGQKFALLQMKSCVSTLLRKFQMLPVTKPEEITFTADLVLRNLEPVQISFVKRNN